MTPELRCRDPQCPDFGDPDFGEATCPSDHADTRPRQKTLEATMSSPDPTADAVTPVMQPRCPHCLHEHYGPAVAAISAGTATCQGCGRTSPRLYERKDYHDLLAAARERRGAL